MSEKVQILKGKKLNSVWKSLVYKGFSKNNLCAMAYNVYCKSEKYGNVYLIQLHPTLACDNYSNECINNVVTALQ